MAIIGVPIQPKHAYVRIKRILRAFCALHATDHRLQWTPVLVLLVCIHFVLVLLTSLPLIRLYITLWVHRKIVNIVPQFTSSRFSCVFQPVSVVNHSVRLRLPCAL